MKGLDSAQSSHVYQSTTPSWSGDGALIPPKNILLELKWNVQIYIEK